MKLPSAIAAGSIAIALFAGGFALGHGVDDDDGSSNDKPQVAGQVFERETTTTSTTAAPAAGTPQAPATSTAPSSSNTATTTASATVVRVTPAPTAPPSTTPSTVVVNPQCGQGTSSAQVSAFTQPIGRTSSTEYQSDIAVDVTNGINQPIQLDALSVRVTLENGQASDVVLTSAPGTIIQPGNTGRYTITINTGKSPAKSFAMSAFAFHTAGHPECPGRAA